MTRLPRHEFWLAIALLAPGALSPVVRAQSGDSSPATWAAATLPESNEALLLSSRIEEAAQAGNYRLAIELAEQLAHLPAGLVAEPAGRTYQPPWRQAWRLLAQLPQPAVELYRQLHDAEVSARFQAAALQADLNALRELFHSYRLSSFWPAIGVELTAHLLDAGAYGEAIEVLRELRRAGVTPPPERDAQLAAALAAAGAARSAEQVVTELRSATELATRADWHARLEQLERWIACRSDAGWAGAAGARGTVFDPAIAAGAVWQCVLAAGNAPEVTDEGRDLAEAVAALRRLPLHQAVLVDGPAPVLIVRLGGGLWAVEADTLTLCWAVSERPAAAPPDVAQLAARGADEVRALPATELLLSNHLRHAVAVGSERVYTIEGLNLLEAHPLALAQPALRAARDALRRNELVARDLDSGRVVWRTAADPTHPLYDVAFQNVPLPLDSTLVAPIVRGDDLNLAVIDPADGRLLREVPLVGPPAAFPDRGGRCLLVADETTLYVCTGNGVIAALARPDLAWKWAAVYPSTLAEQLGQLWWQPPRQGWEANIDPPVIADELLIVAPADCPDLLALDRFSGRECWRLPRRDYPFLLGAVRGGLLVAGGAVVCLDLNDPAGSPPRWRSVPLEITGRPAVRHDRVFVPTNTGIVVLDARNGKLLADQTRLSADSAAPSAATERAANLLATDDALFSVSTTRVVKYPDVARSLARYAPGPGGSDDDRRTLVRAWLEALAGRHEAALAHVGQKHFAEPRLSAARDELLRYVWLNLAAHAPAGDRLSWLGRAAALPAPPAVAGRLALLVGQALEEAGRWPAAVRHYAGLLAAADGACVSDNADPGRRAAVWLHAAERIRVLIAGAGHEACQELLSQTLDASADTARVLRLQRLRIALAGDPLVATVDHMLSAEKLAPELKVRYLPEPGASILPPEIQRRLQLELWDTCVSLGRLAEAELHRRAWETQPEAPAPASSPPAPFAPLTPDEERERVAAIDLACRKLGQSAGAPFGEQVTRQWKIERAELLLDQRRPLTASYPWLLVADLGQRRLALINVYKHQHPQRQTVDGLTGPAPGADAAAESQRFEWAGGRPASWPMASDGYLAAVPVSGGLVCVGLGPERYAGSRLWEFPVPEWSAIPADFDLRTVAGPLGVYLAPRRERIELLGWFDGKLWWQRDLPGIAVARLHLCGQRLVVIGDDQRVWVTDATFARELVPVPVGADAPLRSDCADDMLVVWGMQSVRAIDLATLRERWQRPAAPIDDTALVTGQPWVAFRPRGQGRWYLLDVRDGRQVFDAPLGDCETLTAIVADRQRLLVAGRAPPGSQEGEARVARVAALDQRGGGLLWQRDFLTGVPVNATQLLAHADIVPILLADADERRLPGDASDLPAIELVSKHDGRTLQRFSIRGDYRPAAEATREMCMLVTPARIIVQVAGNLIAYGNSPLRGEP